MQQGVELRREAAAQAGACVAARAPPLPHSLTPAVLPTPAAPPAAAQVPEGPRTLGALRNNINVSIQYLEAWLGGNGCVPLHNLMEDAATAEIRWVGGWWWWCVNVCVCVCVWGGGGGRRGGQDKVHSRVGVQC
jgi:hypothetical protein